MSMGGCVAKNAPPAVERTRALSDSQPPPPPLLARPTGFEQILYLTTAAVHPIAFPMEEQLPRDLQGLNGPRAHRTNAIARQVINEHFQGRVHIVDAGAITALLGEEASKGCHDMRHQDHPVFQQVASVILAAACAGVVP